MLIALLTGPELDSSTQSTWLTIIPVAGGLFSCILWVCIINNEMNSFCKRKAILILEKVLRMRKYLH